MSWRDGTKLFCEIWPSIKKHIPEEDFRKEFTRDLIKFFSDCDMDPTDLRRLDPEIKRILDELDVNEG